MSYCQRCGEMNYHQARFCENCGTALPEEGEKLQPGFGYDIHKVKCRHRLKIIYMPPGEKLSLLGKGKYLFLGNLALIVTASLLLMANLFRTDHPLWQEFLGEKTGLFGPGGQVFTGLYFLLLLLSLLMGGKPLYTRNTYQPSQLIPAILLELGLLLVLAGTTCMDLYFGEFRGTALTTGGYVLLMVSSAGLVLQGLLIREYKRLREKGLYVYVAN